MRHEAPRPECSARLAQLKKSIDVSGVGCLIQVLGLLAPIVISVFLGYIGGAIGMILLVVMLFAGAAKHTNWICVLPLPPGTSLERTRGR